MWLNGSCPLASIHVLRFHRSYTFPSVSTGRVYCHIPLSFVFVLYNQKEDTGVDVTKLAIVCTHHFDKQTKKHLFCKDSRLMKSVDPIILVDPYEYHMDIMVLFFE